MLMADRRHVQQAIELIASGQPITQVSVVSTENKVFASSDVSIIGSFITDESINRVFATGEKVTQIEDRSNQSLYFVFPVLNKPECHACHTAGDRILGAIGITVDSKLLNRQLQDQTFTLIVITGITFLIMGGALTLVFRSSVIAPISGIIASARRIAEGDFSARADIRRDDEVGLMAKSFNEMAERVEHHAQVLEATKLELEDTVQKRTRQLQETAAIRGQLLERLISAQEEERRRIARELHDEAGQAISAIMLDLARAIDSLPVEAAEARQKLAQSRALAAQTLGELRKMIYDLRPEVLDHLGLAPALRSYVKTRLEDKNIKAKLTISGLENRLPPRLETTVFRIIQEVTTNVVRHSGATNVSIGVAVTKTAADVSIDDDGKGFDIETAFKAAESWGLRGIRERASAVGGQLDITSQPGQGTHIRVHIPLEG